MVSAADIQRVAADSAQVAAKSNHWAAACASGNLLCVQEDADLSRFLIAIALHVLVPVVLLTVVCFVRPVA